MSISHFRFSRNHFFYENVIYKLVLAQVTSLSQASMCTIESWISHINLNDGLKGKRFPMTRT